MSDNTTSSSGVGILGILGIVFVTLKLVGVITWSWWWVTLPFWGLLAVMAVVGLVSLLICLLLAAINR